MKRDLEKYIKKINFDKQYKKLIKKYKNKKIVIYGAGQLFQLIYSKYDLTQLNIVGICDRSFDKNSEEQEFMGYKKIFINELYLCDADMILVATLEYLGLIEHLEKNIFKNKKIEIRPLAYMPLKMFLKEVFFGPDKDDLI